MNVKTYATLTDVCAGLAGRLANDTDNPAPLDGAPDEAWAYVLEVSKKSNELA